MAKRQSGKDLKAEIRKTFLHQSLYFRLATQSWVYEGRPTSMGALTRIIAGKLDVAVQRVACAMEVIVFEERVAASQALEAWVTQNDRLPQSDEEVSKYLRLMERPDTAPAVSEANLVALKQWLWQVKRGAMNLDSRWHVALVFWSRENGTGKSFNIRRLLAPIGPFTRNMNVSELGEKFSGQLMASTIVAFLDEFAGVEAANANDFKAILTGKPWDKRVMYSESGFYAENRTSAIATSNVDPPHGYEDTSGARRFWSIHCNGQSMEENVERQKSFDRLDVSKIYASVRTQDQSPHEAASQEVRKLMTDIREERLRTKTSMENWLRERTEEAEPTYKLPLKDAQTDYNRYCGDTRQRIIGGSYKTMSETLKKLGQVVVLNGNRYYMKGRCVSALEST